MPTDANILQQTPTVLESLDKISTVTNLWNNLWEPAWFSYSGIAGKQAAPLLDSSISASAYVPVLSTQIFIWMFSTNKKKI